MNKVLIISLVSIIVLLIVCVGVLVYFVVSDLKKAEDRAYKKYQDEINELKKST